jgi:N-[(2S)-2-amino-2-carboxyethyl]-L-glutamate dehydrogenase
LFAAGKVQQPHKMVLRREETAESEDRHGRFNGLSALIGGADPCTGMKWIGSDPSNRKIGMPRASALIILNNPDTGFPVAVMDGTLINAMRTGAMTALGAHFLAPRITRRIGIIGSGVQSACRFSASIRSCRRWRRLPYLDVTRNLRKRSHKIASADGARRLGPSRQSNGRLRMPMSR